MRNVISLILGGGQGTRLYPLTKMRSKPAVPLAAKYRLIDIPISNCLNSGFNKIYVLTQFLSVSLHRHIGRTYKFDPFGHGFVEILAAQQTSESMDWYQGTADAVRHNMRHFLEDWIEDVLILSGDQLYRMDYRELVATHYKTSADMTIAVLPVSRGDAGSFGIVRLDDAGRVIDFVEKPKTDELLDRAKSPGDWIAKKGVSSRERQYLASMGIYLFKRQVLVDLLNAKPHYTDFGKDLFPASYPKYKVQAFLFDGYWEDVGTIKAFHQAHMALAGDEPPFYFQAPEGPIYTRMRHLPASRVGGATIENCLISDGCIIRPGAKLSRSVVGVRSRLDANVTLRETIMVGADDYETPEQQQHNRKLGIPDIGIGSGCVIERAIIDKGCRIGDNVRIVNRQGIENGENELYVICDGIVCIPKDTTVPAGTVI